MLRHGLFSLLFVLLAGLAQAEVIPPVLVAREANRWPVDPAGMVCAIDSPTSTTFELFIPEQTLLAEDGATTLTLHFHGAGWFLRQEHTRRGATHPLLTANAPEGDAVYELDVMAPGVMENVLQQVDEKLREAKGVAAAHAEALEISGFSAGYAGVRGVLRLPALEPRVARVMLNDSMYVGDGSDSNSERRRPRQGPDGIDPLINFARKAAAGERTLLMEFSATPSMRSVGPMDCAHAVMEALGLTPTDVAAESLPAARRTADFQLVWQANQGNAHFWCYHSEGRPIHLAHVRNQAEMWRALDGHTALEAVPPAVPPRPIAPGEPLPGEIVSIDLETSGTISLHIPKGYKAPKDGLVEITMHFHGASWFIFQEHARRGNGDPVVALELGEGSSAYRIPFEDRDRFRRLLAAVAEVLVARGAPNETTIARVNITSFSAGYGAVRELVKSPEYVSLIQRIVLADSSYGSLDEAALAEGRRVVAREHVEVWAPFARLAMQGEKTFLLTTSDIETPAYASTVEVARALVAELGLPIREWLPLVGIRRQGCHGSHDVGAPCGRLLDGLGRLR